MPGIRLSTINICQRGIGLRARQPLTKDDLERSRQCHDRKHDHH